MALSNTPVPPLRMEKINIEEIYPQVEKDREGEKLKALCDIHEGQKLIYADGTSLIRQFIKPRKMVMVRRPSFKNKIKQSHTLSPD